MNTKNKIYAKCGCGGDTFKMIVAYDNETVIGVECCKCKESVDVKDTTEQDFGWIDTD